MYLWCCKRTQDQSPSLHGFWWLNALFLRNTPLKEGNKNLDYNVNIVYEHQPQFLFSASSATLHSTQERYSLFVKTFSWPIFDIICYNLSQPEWWSWQTRWTQNPVGATPWGFKSLLRHEIFKKGFELERRCTGLSKRRPMRWADPECMKNIQPISIL